MKPRTNFDIYLERQLKDPDFAERFKKAGEAWDVALKLASLRKASGLCVFRRKSATYSDPIRPGIPIQTGHPLTEASDAG